MKKGEVARTVNELIDSWPMIKWLLKQGLINYSELARKIINETGKDISFYSVIIAIRRYTEKMNTKEKDINEKINKIIAEPILSVRDSVVDLTIKKTSENFKKIIELASKINIDKGDLLYVTTGEGEITIITDEKNASVIKKENIIKYNKNLSIIKLKFLTEEFINTPGITYVWFEALSEKGINIIDYGTSLLESYFIIKQEDASEVYNIFRKIIKKAKTVK